MINYGRILLEKEKNNPSSFLRATYLISNVGQAVMCFGRSTRFPDCADGYLAEMKCALGDVFMQCMMMMEENYVMKIKIANMDTNDKNGIWTVLGELENIVIHAGKTITQIDMVTNTTQIYISCYMICYMMGWEPEDIKHMGFLHTLERFEDFAKAGWK